MESVGFKEWAIVCEALGRGEQSIILRKGGIAEGREGLPFARGVLSFSRLVSTSRSRRRERLGVRFHRGAKVRSRSVFSPKWSELPW